MSTRDYIDSARRQLMYQPRRKKQRLTAIKTSVTDPLRVDWLPLELEGRIGMTFVPGKRWDGFTGRWRRDLKTDLTHLDEEYDLDVLVSLMEAFEYEMVGAGELFTEAPKYGIKIVWHPIKDENVPEDLDAYYELIEHIVEAAQEGANVAVHCKGGIGRTGLTASCCLVRLGYAPYDAVMAVRAAREGTITRQCQLDLVWRYARDIGTNG